jgi:hypothetical protein
MKKIIKVSIFALFFLVLNLNNSFAEKGSNCGLVVDNAIVSKSYNWIKFEVYNPSDSTIIITGVKYFKGNEFWREYKDIDKRVFPKTDYNFTHSVKTDNDISFVLQCYKQQINKPAARSIMEMPTPKKTWAQEFIIKIFK